MWWCGGVHTNDDDATTKIIMQLEAGSTYQHAFCSRVHYLKSDEANLAAAHPASAAAMVSKEGYYSKKLYEAVCQNDIDTIKSCLDNGADVNYVETDFQVSVLHVACFESRNDILRMLIRNNVNLLEKDKNSGQTVIDLLQEILREYLENYPKSKYIYSAPTLKRFEAQHSILKFLNEFVHGKPTIKNLEMPIIYCSTDKNYCYVGFQASSTHKHIDLWQCYGACEWEIRSTSIGSATDKIYSTTFDVIFETAEQRNGNEDFLQSMLKPKFGKKMIAYPSNRHVAKIEPGYNFICMFFVLFCTRGPCRNLTFLPFASTPIFPVQSRHFLRSVASPYLPATTSL